MLKMASTVISNSNYRLSFLNSLPLDYRLNWSVLQAVFPTSLQPSKLSWISKISFGLRAFAVACPGFIWMSFLLFKSTIKHQPSTALVGVRALGSWEQGKIELILQFWNYPFSFPESSFPLTSGRKTRDLGGTISVMRHRRRLRSETGWSECGYFLCYFNRVAPRVSRFPTAGEGERRLWERDWEVYIFFTWSAQAFKSILNCKCVKRHGKHCELQRHKTVNLYK